MAVRPLIALIAAVLCAASAVAHAAEPAKRSFGRLDLAGKLLSAQRFGPASSFAPASLGTEIAPPLMAPPMRAEATPKPQVADAPKPRPSVAAKQPDRSGKTRTATRPRSNPLDAYARDTRRPAKRSSGVNNQSWPCKGGGICGWK